MNVHIDRWLEELRAIAREDEDPEMELHAIELMVEARRVQQEDESKELDRLRVQISASQAAQSSLLVENLRLRDRALVREND